MATTLTTIRNTVDELAEARAEAKAANDRVKVLEMKLKGWGDGTYEGTEHTVKVTTSARKNVSWNGVAMALGAETRPGLVEQYTKQVLSTALRITAKIKEAA